MATKRHRNRAARYDDGKHVPKADRVRHAQVGNLTARFSRVAVSERLAASAVGEPVFSFRIAVKEQAAAPDLTSRRGGSEIFASTARQSGRE